MGLVAVNETNVSASHDRPRDAERWKEKIMLIYQYGLGSAWSKHGLATGACPHKTKYGEEEREQNHRIGRGSGGE